MNKGGIILLNSIALLAYGCLMLFVNGNGELPALPGRSSLLISRGALLIGCAVSVWTIVRFPRARPVAAVCLVAYVLLTI
jgi:hypothetical protein